MASGQENIVKEFQNLKLETSVAEKMALARENFEKEFQKIEKEYIEQKLAKESELAKQKLSK